MYYIGCGAICGILRNLWNYRNLGAISCSHDLILSIVYGEYDCAEFSYK